MTTWLAVVALLGAAPPPRSALVAPPSAEASPAPVPSPSPSPRPADAFAIQAEAGEATLRVTGYLHADGRFFPDQPDLAHSFLLRRARPSIQVSFRRRFDLVLTPDFGGGAAVIQDAYVDVRYAQSARLRAGSLRLDDALVSSGLVDPARSAREAFAWALGLNWCLDRHVKQSVSFERTTFDGGTATGDRRAENAVILRIQLSY